MTPKDSQCVLDVAVVLQFGVLAGSAQTGTYLFTGSETNITLNPGTYDITAYGAKGGSFEPSAANRPGGLGAEMSAEFNFSAPTTLVLLVGGSGGTGVYYGGGGGGGSFIVNGTTALVVAGAGGGGSSSGVGGPGVTTTSGGTFGFGAGTGGSEGSGGGGTTYPGGGGGGGGGLYGNGGNAAGTGSTGGGGGGFSFFSGGGGGSSGTYFGGGGGYAGGYGGGGGGGGGYPGAGGGGGYSGGSGGGGGGGSIIDSSAIMVLAEISGVASPDDSPNGEIIITAVPGPSTLTYQVINGELVLNWVQGTLLSAGTVNGTYTPVSGATSPYTNSMTVAQQYFRVLVGADATLKAGPGWTVPNQAHAANTAMKTLFHAVGQWRGVADRHR
jgi:hypothetical protein